MYNKVFLIGNLTRDPELRYTTSGIPVARFAIAVNRIRRKSGEAEDGQGAGGGKNQDVDFINIVAWRRLAEICGEYLKKGSPVAVEGRLQIRSYETKAGVKRTMTEAVVDNMQMLGRKSDAAGTHLESAPDERVEGPGGLEGKDDEIPF